MRSPDLQVGVLVGCVVILSAFVKNIGALAIFIPAAVQVARRNNRSPSEFLMPLSFASLLGGSMTLVGTSPNILAASVRQQLGGRAVPHVRLHPGRRRDRRWSGSSSSTFGWRLIPHGLRGSAGATAFRIEDYTSEVRVAEGSAYIGQTVREVEELAGGDISITAIIRDRDRGGRQIPSGGWRLSGGDVLVVEADPQALELVARDGKLEIVGSEEPPATVPGAAAEEPKPAKGRAKPRARTEAKAAAARAPRKAEPKAPEPTADVSPERLAVVEALVGLGSILIGRSAAELRLRERYGVNVLAVEPRRPPQQRAAAADAVSDTATRSYCKAMPSASTRSSPASAACRSRSAS